MSVAFLPAAQGEDDAILFAKGKWHDPAADAGVLETAYRSGDASRVGDMASAAWNATWLDQNSTARTRAYEEAFRRIGAKVRAATGEDLGDPTLRNSADIVSRINAGEFKGFHDPKIDELITGRQDAFLERAQILKSRNPDKLADLDLSTEMFRQGFAVSKEAREGQARQMAREDMGWIAKGIGLLSGAALPALAAPENVLTVAAPGGGAGATAAARILSSSLYGAAGAAVGTAAAQPEVQGYKAAQGLDHGLADAAGEIAIGAGVGALLGGALRGLGEAGARLLSGKGGPADLAAAIRATGREPTPDELAALPQAQAADAADAALLRHLADLPPDRREAAVLEALAALQDPTAPRPGRELRAPPGWSDDAAQAAVREAAGFDDAVDRLRASNTHLSAIASGDPGLRAAGYVASLDETALARVREHGLPPEHAALIATKTGDAATQAELAGVLAQVKATSRAEARMALDDHLNAKYATETAAARMGRPLDDGPLAPHRVVDADGRGIVVTPRLVDLADLVTSDQPGFPKELQPRDRARAASGQQVREIATRLDPERLGRSAEADRGAPIVGRDGVVESGNGRVGALRAAYAEGGEAADAYRAWLTKLGFDLDGMERPALVRFRETELDAGQRAAFTLAANKSATLDMSAAERALADARMLDADMLAAIVSPDLAAAGNADFARAFVGRLPQAEQGRLVTSSGALSPEGLDRIRKALAARAYGDSPILARLADAIDDEVRGLSVALMHAAPDMARLRAEIAAGRVRPEMDVTDELIRAVDEAATMRQSGTTLADRLAQMDAFDARDGIVDAFLRLFYDPAGKRPASSKSVADALRFYADEARTVSAAADQALFDAAGPADVMSAMLRRTDLDPTVSPVRTRPRPAAPDQAAAPGGLADDLGPDAGAGGRGAGPAGPDGAGGGDDGLRLDAGQTPEGGPRLDGERGPSLFDQPAGGRGDAGLGGDARAAGEVAGGLEDQAAAVTPPERLIDLRGDEKIDKAAERAGRVADVVKACKS